MVSVKKDTFKNMVNVVRTRKQNLSADDINSMKQYGIAFVALVFVYCIGYHRGNSFAFQDSFSPTSAGGSWVDRRPHYLEELMYHYGSEKSHDDRAYTDLYQAMFNPIRKSVRHVMEVGVGAGQSIQAWYHYFPNAQIHAIDTGAMDSVLNIAKQYSDRISFHQRNFQHKKFEDYNQFVEIGLRNNSVDILIEDGSHRPRQQQELLARLFPLVKPGGFYIIESIAMYEESPGTGPIGINWQETSTMWQSKAILRSNDAFLVDTHIGHRDWDKWVRKNKNAQDHTHHDSFALVIRKRVTPVPPVKMNIKSVSMRGNKVTYQEPM